MTDAAVQRSDDPGIRAADNGAMSPRQGELRRVSRESGQAAVEAAITLPLNVFIVLGTLQLFMLLQGRIMAEHAAFKAVRAGVVQHGNCTAMTHAAIAALLPSFTSFLGASTRQAIGSGATPAQQFALAFKWHMTNKYKPGAQFDRGFSGDIVWLIREQPLFPISPTMEADFDDTTIAAGNTQLELRLIYWYPLRIPFADWVMSRMFLAHVGLLAYTAQNPLLESQQANWQQEGKLTIGGGLNGAIKAELLSRVAANEYVWPIQASYVMRMMTPPRAANFATQNCPPAP